MVTAGDLFNISNGTGSESVESLFSNGENEPARTFFVSLAAADFGMPEDGIMTLSITGGDAPWSGTAEAVNGLFRFSDIPMVPVGSYITVTITGCTKDGAVVCSAYNSGTATAGGFTMSIPVLGPPVIRLGTNGTASGTMTSKEGNDYEVIEYTGAGLPMTVINGSPNGTMDVTVNGSPVSVSTTLPNGYNAIVATVTGAGGSPVSVARNVYVVKALPEPVLSLTGDHYSSEDTTSYEMWKYSYLSSNKIKLSVTDSYDGNDAATGSATMTVMVTGETSFTSDSGNVTDLELNSGINTIAITLTKPLCTPVSISKTCCIKIKPVKVTISGSINIWCHEPEGGTINIPSLKCYLKATNPDGTYSGSTLVVSNNNVSWGGGDGYVAPIKPSTDPDAPCVWLTAPDSILGFRSEQATNSNKGGVQFGYVPDNDSIMSRTLSGLKGSLTFDSQDRNWSGAVTSENIRRIRFKNVTVAVDDSTDP